MRVHIIENNIVINTIMLDSIEDTERQLDADLLGGGIGWTWENNKLVPPKMPDPTPEEIQESITSSVQERLDSFAKTRGYDDIKSACTYAGCSIPRFDTEGTHCRDKRAETWAILYQIMTDVQLGIRPMPTNYSDIEAELPKLEWPA